MTAAEWPAGVAAGSTRPDGPDGPDHGLRLLRLGGSREYSTGPLVLTAVAACSPLLAVGCAQLAGAGLPWPLLVFAPLVLLLAGRPGSIGHLVSWFLVGAIWFVAVPGPFTWWAVPAAAAGLAGHVGAGFLASIPPDVAIPAVTVRRYARRCGVVLLVVVAVAGLSALTLRVAPPGVEALVAVALLLAAGWLWLTRTRPDPS